MRTRSDNVKCEFCGKSLNDTAYEETHTKQGKDVCNYECLSGLYVDEIPENEDFISVPE